MRREVPKIYKLTSLTGVTNWFLLWGTQQLARAAILGRCQVVSCTAIPHSFWEQKESGAHGGKKYDKLSIELQTALWNLPDRDDGVCAIAIELNLIIEGRIITYSVLSVMKAIKTKPECTSLLPCKSNMDSLMREGHYLSSHSNFTHERNVAHIGN